MQMVPDRVISGHLPLGERFGGRAWPLACSACGLPWPCHTYQRTLQAACSNREDRMRANMLIPYLRLMSRPELAFVGTEVHAAMLGWIDGAVVAQRKLEQARDAARTGARLAVERITTFARNLRDSILTDGNGRRPVMGQPTRGTVGFGEVLDGGKVVSRRG